MEASELGRPDPLCDWCGLAMAQSRPGGRCEHCGATGSQKGDEYALVDPEAEPVAAAAEGVPVVARTTVRAWSSNFLHEWGVRGSVLEKEILALVFLSVADLMTTYHLLRTHPKFYESNPIAEWVFLRWDVAGMAVFKFAIVAFVVTVAEVAERRRPGLGRLVLMIGCAASAVVVIHGLRLALGE